MRSSGVFPRVMIQAVIFDLDDTLYPEQQFALPGYRAVADKVLRDLGVDIYPTLERLLERGPQNDIFRTAIQEFSLEADEPYVKQLVSVYRGHPRVLCPFPEVRGTLTELKSSYKLGLISDGNLQVQCQKFSDIGLKELFDATVFTDIWGRSFWKPHTRGFEECARLLSLRSVDCVYVGDNPEKDFIGARRSGMRTIRVRRASTLHYHVVTSGSNDADCEISSLESISTVLNGMNT